MAKQGRTPAPREATPPTTSSYSLAPRLLQHRRDPSYPGAPPPPAGPERRPPPPPQGLGTRTSCQSPCRRSGARPAMACCGCSARGGSTRWCNRSPRTGPLCASDTWPQSTDPASKITLPPSPKPRMLSAEQKPWSPSGCQHPAPQVTEGPIRGPWEPTCKGVPAAFVRGSERLSHDSHTHAAH